MHQREFTIANEYPYNRRSAPRWVLAHVLRYPLMPLIFIITAIGMAAAQSLGAVFVGQAFDALIGGGGLPGLRRVRYRQQPGAARAGPARRARYPRRALPEPARQKPDFFEPPVG